MTDLFLIHNDKRKLILHLFISVFFVVMGVWLVAGPENNSTLNIIIGIIDLLFFGVASIHYIRDFFNNQPKLIISKKGLTDRASYMPTDTIPWVTIQEVRLFKAFPKKYLKVMICDPEKFIDGISNKAQQNAYRRAYKKHQTPIIIPINNLKIKPAELMRIIKEHLNA